MSIEEIINEYGIKPSFSQAACEQAKTANRVRVASYLSHRLDLRGKNIFSFVNEQGAASDRAISISKKHDVFTVGLHISDVAEYVCDNTPLDLEARSIGAAIKTPKKRFDMLPPEITHGVCDLKEGCDRLAVSLFFDIGANGSLVDIRMGESVVRVAKTCVYSEVDTICMSADFSAIMPLREKYAVLIPSIETLYELGAILHAKRIENGGLDCVNFKRKLSFSDDGAVIAQKIVYDSDFRQLVAEIMTFAGNSLGEHFKKEKISCLYCTGDNIPEKLLYRMAELSGCKYDSANPKSLFAISNAAKGTPYTLPINEAVVSFLPCRRYDSKPGLFALAASDSIVHFTRPANFYSDLIVQRILKELIQAGGKLSNLNALAFSRMIVREAENATQTEKRIFALKASVSDYCACDYMRNNEGCAFEATIYDRDGDKLLVLCRNGAYGYINAKNRISDEDNKGVTLDGKRIEYFTQLFMRPVAVSEKRFESVFEIDENSKKCFM